MNCISETELDRSISMSVQHSQEDNAKRVSFSKVILETMLLFDIARPSGMFHPN